VPRLQQSAKFVERWGQQAGPLHQLAVGEQVVGPPAVSDLASQQHSHPLCVLGDQGHVVGDHDDRDALLVQPLQAGHQAAGVALVLAEGWLVEDQHPLADDQHRCHTQPPLLALAQAEGIACCILKQAEISQHRLYPLVDRRFAQPPRLCYGAQAEGYLVAHSTCNKLMLRVLEHITYQASSGSTTQAAYVLPQHSNLTLCR